MLPKVSSGYESGDAEAEKKFKEALEAYAVLSDPEKDVSMISLVMLLLKVVQEQAADMADLILTVLILEIFSEISLEIALAADAERTVRTRTDEEV